MSKSYRFHCRNPKCRGEFHRYFNTEEFEKQQYSSSGWCCFNCGYPKMAVIKSNKSVNDGFAPGYQRSIGKYCATKAEYNAHLKNMGLIELGYEDLPKNEHKTTYWTDDILKKVYDYGVQISDREAEALKKGILDD